jgi:hypothetical protein
MYTIRLVTEKYKASFIYITPSILAKISFILGPISITPIVYKNQVSGHGVEWNSLAFGGH